MSSDGFRFLKGHGTENDFVLLPDPDGTVHGDLDPRLVRALCDRRAGIGADGVIRVVRRDGRWFMDYRNSDGSLSEMCGNGVRVLARYLADHEHVPSDRPLEIGTRGGLRTLRFQHDGRITADMGPARLLGETKVGVPGRSWPATRVSMGNPHAVAFVDDLSDAGTLSDEPSYDHSDFPDGVNVEFVVRRADGHVEMRVHERGSGETRSCGTGACAAMVASVLRDGGGRGTAYRVDVPGGSLTATWREDGHVELTGPAVIVADGTIRTGPDGLAWN